MSTVSAVASGTSDRNANQPAAYKPATTVKQLYPPYDIHPVVLSATDGAAANGVFQSNVTVGGSTYPYSVIWLAQGLKPGYFTNIAEANAAGTFAFVVPVGYGSTTLQLFSENSVDNYSNIDTLTVNRGTAIEAWDSLAVHAIQVQGLTSPEAARDLAILHSAQYDAVANASQSFSPYKITVTAAKGASAEAAADAAGYAVLTALFPAQAATFVAAEESALTGLPITQATKDGLSLGQSVANQTLAARSVDGSATAVSYPDSNVAGFWRPTAPGYLPAADAQYAQVTPFVIASDSAYRPGAPPAVGSAAYDQALSQVSSLGRVGSTTRTTAQTNAALFWADGAGTATDPGHWNAIADQLVSGRKDTLATDARLFAELDFALADAGFATTDSKYAYDEWRPISAVQAVDPTFSPLLTTPNSPSYVSGNAAYGAAAAGVLDSFLGKRVKFTDSSESPTTPGRSFASIDAAAAEDAQSRVYGGVNFSTDVQAGTKLGGQVAQAVLSRFSKGK